MIAIVGAGITGLYLGKLLQDKGLDFRLYEAKENPGGNIATLREGPYLMETGPNSVRMNANFHHLTEDLGLGGDLRFTDAKAGKRFVLKNGKYRPIPSGPGSLLFGSFFKFREVLRILKERRIAPGQVENETVDAFFRRRFGDPIADYLVGPFISGIYAGDSRKLLIGEAFPKVLEWEHSHGSVLKGFFKGREKSEYKGIFSYERGLGQMALALGEHLGDRLVTGSAVKAISKQNGGWSLDFGGRTVEAGQVVLALPAYAIADLLAPIDSQAANDLRKVYYPPVSVLHASFPRSAVKHPLNGFGALHNHLEASNILGVIFSSTTFPDRCPTNEVLLTAFIGGARNPANARLSDSDLTDAAMEDYQKYLGVQSAPVFSKIIRWEHAIPQYDLNVLPSRAHLPTYTNQGLHLAGNWTHGISLPSCLEKAQSLCEQLSQ